MTGDTPDLDTPDLDTLMAIARRELPESDSTLDELEARRAEPCRVAIAGRVKTGKSTLLNALVGERLAATGVGERTKVVARYRWGRTPEVRMVCGDANRDIGISLPFRRSDGALDADLPEPLPSDLDHLDIRWPAPSLQRRVLIDTPGLGALDSVAGARTVAFMSTAGDGASGTAGADAVLYLMRHRHRDDLAYLEAFSQGGLGRPSPITAVGVLSRADEIGGGDLGALDVARRVAANYYADPLLRPLCQTVVPVCGLLAETALTLTDAETRTLVTVADASPADRAAALRSVDDFRDDQLRLGISAPEREVLLTRFGLFGLRQAVAAIDLGHRSAHHLADELRRASGLDELATTIDRVFGQRGELLTARSVVAALARLARRHQSVALGSAVEAYIAARHEWRELECIIALRSGTVPLATGPAAEAERILGGNGDSPTDRLGVAGDSPASVQLAAMAEALARWQRRAGQPLTDPAVVAVADAVSRSLEGIAARST